MRVIALRKFKDLKAKTIRNEGDVFEVDPDRYAEIMATRTDLVSPFEAEAEDQATEPAEAKKKPSARSTRKTSKAKATK